MSHLWCSCKSIPNNFYAFFALVVVVLTIFWYGAILILSLACAILAFSMGLLFLVGVFYMLKIRYEGDLVKDKNLNENMQRF